MPIPSWLPLLLGLLSAVGPVATDMYLPAFPAIEAALGTGAGGAQITLAAWFGGLAIGQITQGTLADRFGRRWPLIIGMAVFTLASAGCALAPTLLNFSILRGLAAFGGAAGMVISRAVVRDLTDGLAAARMMSRLMLVMGVGPILAPTLGGVVLEAFGWHMIFWVNAGFGAICVVWALAALPETQPENMRTRLHAGAFVTRAAYILTERQFITNTMMSGFAMFGMFAFLAGSPSVFIEHFHLTPGNFGALFGTGAGFMIVGSQINPRILPRFGTDRVLAVSTKVYLAGTGTLLAMAFFGPDWWLVIAAPIVVAFGSQGFTNQNAVVSAMGKHAMHAGSASALFGTLTYGLASLSATVSGILADGTPRPMALMMFTGAAGTSVFAYLRPKRG
jgi:DHA1 family bicyclomycin/chloramphenicol resistance-like MFS transporter